MLMGGSAVLAQETPPRHAARRFLQSRKSRRSSPVASCIQPPPVVRWQDYQGPFAKVVGAFGRKLERKLAVSPHYKPGAKLCTLEIKDKFRLFINN